MKSKVVVGSDLSTSKENFLQDILIFSDSINSGNYSILGTSSLLTVGWADCFRTFIERFSDNEGAIKNLVIASLSNLSAISPHSVELYIRTLIGGGTINTGASPKRIGSKQVIQDIKTNCRDPFIIKHLPFLIEGINLAGSIGHITTNVRGDLRRCQAILTEGFRSNCSLNSFFREHIDSFSLTNCKALVVAGKILEISEIHHILQESYDTKQPFVLITTGLSDDVSNTLFVNWTQGKTKVIPFFIKDDVESINEIKDISIACNVTPCSNETGIRLSSIDTSEISLCDIEYNAKKDVLKIKPSNESLAGINKLRLEVKKKLIESDIDDVKQLLQARLSKLCLRNIDLYIPGEYSAKGMLEDKLSSFFSHISRCASQGVIDVRKYYYPDYHIQLLPAHDAALAIKRAVSDRRVIDNIRAVVRLERD